MVLNQSAKEEIKGAADIVELIGQFVQLRKAGRNYVGLCPFHAEKAPSFTVNPERQTFHCFGCKKGGDIFSFWMEYHSSTFPEALRDLAERYQVEIGEGFFTPSNRGEAAQREAIFKINEVAAVYFQTALSHPSKGEPARAYLKQRLLSAEILSDYRIGYAPAEWDGLTGTLKRSQLDLDAAVLAGLIIPKRTGGYYDRFRGRIMFPIFDLRQNVIGFGGRVLDDALPKYLNTPETPVFHKGESLYGLHAAHARIRETRRAVVVEGYMDCLALKKHGLDEVVATLGTALTEKHVRRLKGYAGEAVVVFDSDSAGKAAVLKSLPVFSNEGLPAKAVVLPENHDPDSFVNANGLSGFTALLEKAVPIFDFYLEEKMSPTTSREARVLVLKEILPALADIHSFAMRSLYVRRLSEKVGVKEDVVLAELASLGKSVPSGVSKDNTKDHLFGSKAEKRLTDVQLLNLLVCSPEAVSRLLDCECEIVLSDPVVKEIVKSIFERYREAGCFDPDDLLESLKSETACERLREILHRPIVYSDQDVEQAVADFEKEIFQAKISASIKRAKKEGDVQRIVELTKMKTQGPARP